MALIWQNCICKYQGANIKTEQWLGKVVNMNIMMTSSPNLFYLTTCNKHGWQTNAVMKLMFYFIKFLWSKCTVI